MQNDMVDEVNKRKDALKEQHSDATEEQIMKSVQSQQIEVLGMVLKTHKGKKIRGMGRGGERDLSHSSNGSTSCSRPPRFDEQQFQELQERYEQRLKESEERAQQQIQESQVAAIYEHLGMSLPPPPQFPPPPPQSSPPPQVSHRTMMIEVTTSDWTRMTKGLFLYKPGGYVESRWNTKLLWARDTRTYSGSPCYVHLESTIMSLVLQEHPSPGVE
ncbi:hypothetical protein ACLB2K_005725 [Fragaria x ananassa]